MLAPFETMIFWGEGGLGTENEQTEVLNEIISWLRLYIYLMFIIVYQAN